MPFPKQMSYTESQPARLSREPMLSRALREALQDDDPVLESPYPSLFAESGGFITLLGVTSTLPTVLPSPLPHPALWSSATPRTRGNYSRREETDATAGLFPEKARTHTRLF